MEFRLLGPLEVQGRDGAIALGGRKQRAVLAHLLLHADRLITADRLIDLVWDDDPPPAARNVLQSYVSRLRKSLGPERLKTRPGGYVLRAREDEIDADRFAALVQQARASAPIDPQAALDSYRKADALWRGAAVEDLRDQPSLLGEIAHLEELRMVAVEERIVVELALGRHAELVAELEALAAAHPLREGLWAHLMTALYRSGRQAEALSAYQRARTILARDLALEPSVELKRLQMRVLDQDPSLETAGVPVRGLRLLERIGEGSFGVVHRATQPQVGRDVAVKIVRPRFANDPGFIRRFEAEAQLVARLEHPRIVPLYDYWREPTGTYLVMRLLRGGSLRDVLDAGALYTDEVLGVMAHIGAALATAHRHGVVHRDVKPANILFDEERNAYLSDFGIAMGIGPLREAQAFGADSSSAYYLSPEEARGEAPTERADIYSLGLVLFEMLTGRHPWLAHGETGAAGGRGDELPSLSTLRPDLPSDVDQVVRRATCQDPAGRYPDVSAMVSAVATALEATAARPAIEVPTHNPYKGLLPFLEPDAADFFGREQLVGRLLDRLGDDDPGVRVLALVGASGSGKSSVVRAGLVPALRAGAVTGSERWLIAEMTPGSNPFAELASAFLPIAAAPAPRNLLEILQRDGTGLLEAVDWLLPDKRSRLLLVIDQFEEVFTLTESGASSRFLDVLTEAAADPSGRLRIVLTLRADVFDRALENSGFADHLRSGTELVVTLTPDELERAITFPAARAGFAIEPGLVAQLVSDMHDRPAALPLLQFALAELVDRTGSTTLTSSAYAELGGVAGAVARGAEDIYGSLPSGQQEQARQALLRLVQLADSAVPGRRRVLRSELVSLGGDVAGMEAVIDAFVGRRLLSLDRDADTREPTVELAHESLVNAWERLGGWIEEAREDLGNQRLLARAAHEWGAAGGDSAFLVTGSRLQLFEWWRSQTDLALTPEEDAFLAASLAQRELAEAEEAARDERERALERRSLRRFQYLGVALTAGIVVAIGLAMFAFDQRAGADRARRVAEARELAAASVANLDVDPERSVLLALAAVEESRTDGGTVLPEAVDALHRAVVASRIVMRVPGLGGALDWSPAGDLFVTEGPEESGLIDIRDATTGESVRSFRGHDADVNLVAFSDDGSLLGTSGDDGTVHLWDPATGEPRGTFDAGGGPTWGVAFSPDGSLLAASSWDDGVVRVWNIASGELVSETTPLAPSLSTSFSPDGRRLVVGSFDSTSYVVDVRTGEEVVALEGHEQGTRDVDWSPDGRWIATSGGDGAIRIFDARTGGSEAVLYGHRGEVVAADWSSDSGRLVTGSADGTVKVWAVDETGGRELLSIPVQEHGGGLWVDFSPDGTHVMTGDQGITAVKIFDVSEQGDAEWTNVATDGAGAAEFTPDGTHLVTSGGDGSLTVWEARTGRRSATLGAPRPGAMDTLFAPRVGINTRGEVAVTAPGAVTVHSLDGTSDGTDLGATAETVDVAWSPDGSLLAMAGADGRLEIVDRSGERVAELADEEGFMLTRTAFSPDGELVATSRLPTDRVDPDRLQVTVWDWRKQEVVRVLPGGGPMSFSESGELLVNASEAGGPVRVWNLRTGEEVARLVGHTGAVTDVEFAPTGSVVATGSADGTIRLWDADTGVEQLTLRGHRGAVVDVAFGPDGTALASLGSDGVVRVWARDLDELITLAEHSVTRTLTSEECARYTSACG